MARSAVKQPLPVFPELLDEMAGSWKDRPHSGRSPTPRAFSFDCEAMESRGMLHMPPMELLVAAHLHPRLSSLSSRTPMLSLKSDRFKSTLSERAYRATTLNAGALNALLFLTAYQAEQLE